MKRWSHQLPFAIFTLLAITALAGCGGARHTLVDGDLSRGKPTTPTTPPPPSPVTPPAIPAGYTAVPLNSFRDAWPDSTPRWMDIGDVQYSAKFRTNFKSESSGTIYAAYQAVPTSGVLNVQVWASGLKPNFCYQIKMLGKPGVSGSPGGGLWGSTGEADMTGNTNIVLSGRYWDYGTETEHFNTQDRASVVADPYYQKGWVAGYIVLGCFVTDASGNTPGWIKLDADNAQYHNGSYHVVFKTGQTPDQPAIGPFNHTISRTGSALSPAPYPAKLTGASIDLFLQQEPGTNQPYRLSSGNYDVVLMLTEESFHSAKNSLGGFWDTVRVSDWPTIASPVSGVPWTLARGTRVQFTSQLPPVKLAFIQEPTSVAAGAAIDPPVKVAILDANNNVANVSAPVTLSLKDSTGNITAAGSAGAVNGVATFAGLSVSSAGTAYTLVASSGSLTLATSAAFDVTEPIVP